MPANTVPPVTQSKPVNPAMQALSSQSAAADKDPDAQYRITNRGGAIEAVPVVHVTTGHRTMVFVQPGGKPKIAPGYRVDSVYAARNPHVGSTAVTK